MGVSAIVKHIWPDPEGSTVGYVPFCGLKDVSWGSLGIDPRRAGTLESGRMDMDIVSAHGR